MQLIECWEADDYSDFLREYGIKGGSYHLTYLYLLCVVSICRAYGPVCDIKLLRREATLLTLREEDQHSPQLLHQHLSLFVKRPLESLNKIRSASSLPDVILDNLHDSLRLDTQVLHDPTVYLGKKHRPSEQLSKAQQPSREVPQAYRKFDRSGTHL